MPRPVKERNIRDNPICCKFVPEKIQSHEKIKLSLDEFDVIRKCDFERLSQENCASTMNISRTTVQRIYASARMKIAEALVRGIILEIEGGNVTYNSNNMFENTLNINEKGEVNMKIAIGVDGEKVAGHFGQCNDFIIYEIIDNVKVSESRIHDDVHVHQERPQFLKDLGVDVLIMNTMGKGAYNRLIALNIKCVNAEDKNINEALEAYLNNTLNKELVGHECSGCGSHNHSHEHKGHHHG